MPQDNRIILIGGAVLAIVAAVVLALMFGGGRDRPDTPPPAAQGGLTVDLADAPGLDGTRELECYVEGRSIGMATLADCARRNGLATEALDVGVDQSGAVVAFRPPPGPPAIAPGEDLEPLPGPELADNDAAPPPQTGGSICMAHSGGAWRTAGAMGLNACVRELYAGTCVRPGDALYGRWGETTLRLVPGRVEQSNDDRRFRTLANQDRSCQFPDL